MTSAKPAASAAATSQPDTKTHANSMWGGRYASGPASIMAAINVSIETDQRLWREDVAGSLAHAAMLVQQGVLSAADGVAIKNGLSQIASELEQGKFPLSATYEDIHLNIEARLTERIGEAGKRLHTGRSRNDQVATDFRLWVRQACEVTTASVLALQGALLQVAAQNIDTLMPGFTHLQPAQPVSLAHHLLAYHEMLRRDVDRLLAAQARLNECPLGAAALAGTSFPLDRQATAKALGFAGPMANSMDAVADRDFAIDYLAAASLLSVHLSRLAEEIILWATPQFGFIRLPDALSTGSSIMPQKRNPDAAELVRGKTGRVVGHLVSLLMTLKALPLTYNKDMQEDKPPVFDTFDTLQLTLAAMQAMVSGMQVNGAAMAAAAGAGFTTATELADWLVQELAMPFRDAHHVTGALVKLAEERQCQLHELPLALCQTIEPRLHQGVFAVLTPAAALARRNSGGGTAPSAVRAALAEAKARWQQDQSKLQDLQQRTAAAFAALGVPTNRGAD